MTENHPITPPPELIQQWLSEHFGFQLSLHESSALMTHTEVFTKACRWGADRQLEMCKEWLEDHVSDLIIDMLHDAMRPKPPSLAEQALSVLYAITSGADDTREFYQDIETIKTALGRLQELEKPSDDQG